MSLTDPAVREGPSELRSERQRRRHGAAVRASQAKPAARAEALRTRCSRLGAARRPAWQECGERGRGRRLQRQTEAKPNSLKGQEVWVVLEAIKQGSKIIRSAFSKRHPGCGEKNCTGGGQKQGSYVGGYRGDGLDSRESEETEEMGMGAWYLTSRINSSC